jgi:hypothetical protein
MRGCGDFGADLWLESRNLQEERKRGSEVKQEGMWRAVNFLIGSR